MMKEFFQPLKVHESFNIEQHFRATYTYIATLYIAMELLGAEEENTKMFVVGINWAVFCWVAATKQGVQGMF